MPTNNVEQAVLDLIPTDLAGSSEIVKQVSKVAAKESIKRHNQELARRAAKVVAAQEKEVADEAKARAGLAKDLQTKMDEERRSEEAEANYRAAQAAQALTEGDLTGVIASKMNQEDGARFLASVNRSTTRRDVQALLNSLNINMNLQLTKNDTSQLLACLLTANETQLKQLMANKKTPVAIKIVIKRLLSDMDIGDMSSLERLWDRVFGKAPITDSFSPTLVAKETIERSVIPESPVSRQTYEIIRRELYGISPEEC